jgi:hypothetical protein
MIRRIFAFSLLIVLTALPAGAQPPGTKTYLLNISAGQTPTDTGTNATKFSIEDHPELGKALKVLLVDSVGELRSRVTDWTPFKTLAFNVINTETSNVTIGFNVRHKETKNYETRVDVPITLKPGMNEVRLPITSLTNTNGSTADLANVDRWYIATANKRIVTLLFSDIWFESTASSKGKAGLKKGKMPQLAKVIEFTTPEADAICSALQIFPENNPWNLAIDHWPLHPNSKAIVKRIGADKPFRYNPDMAYIFVPPSQKKVDVKIFRYPDESDKGPYPVPDNIPIEGWPSEFMRRPNLKGLTLDDVQRDKINQDGDRHGIVVDPTRRMLYEFYRLKKTATGWQAAQASIFDLKSNKLRPDGWTSTDAAGLPIFPAVIRYDELKRGMVEHAVRVTFAKTRRAYVHPATHFASTLTDEDLPRMGERFRLRADFPIKGFTPETTAILKGLQKYGMICADNGLDWALSCAPDPRIPELHLELRKLKGSDFEVVTPPAGYVPAK